MYQGEALNRTTRPSCQNQSLWGTPTRLVVYPVCLFNSLFISMMDLLFGFGYLFNFSVSLLVRHLHTSKWLKRRIFFLIYFNIYDISHIFFSQVPSSPRRSLTKTRIYLTSYKKQGPGQLKSKN